MTGFKSSRRELIAAAVGGVASAVAGGAVAAAAFESAPGAAAVTRPVQPAGLPVDPAGDTSLSSAERPIDIISTHHLEASARQVMSPLAYAIIAGGTDDEVTLRLNTLALSSLLIRPRRLQGFGRAELRTRLLGLDLPFPFYVTPMGQNDLVHVQAELAVARGAAALGALYVASGAASHPMEKIAQATPAPKWFQIYMNADPAVNRALLARARKAGYRAIMLVVDAMGPGYPESARALTLGSPTPAPRPVGNDDRAYGGVGSFYDLKRDFDVSDVGFAREASGGLPVLVKGILRPDDAARCMEAGAAGVVVSTHGGRQMDGVDASINALGAVVRAVDGRGPVLFDSGVRRGTDILRALALGAAAVGIGRPVLYALSVGGGAGVTSVLAHLRDELGRAMLLAGARDIAALSPDYLDPA